MRTPPLAFMVALTLAACGWDTYQPAAPGTGGSGGASQGGAGGEVGGAGGAGGGGMGGMAPIDCGTVDMLGETFDEAHDDQLWSAYASSSGNITGATGALTFRISTSSASNTEFTTRHFHDMRGSSMAAEVSSIALPNPHWAILWVGPDGNNHARFHYQNGALRPSYELAGSGHDLASIPYSATDHRWWRIREEAGTVYWEVSPDNVTYTAVAERPVSGLFPFDNVRARFRVYAGGGVPAMAQTVVVDTIAVEGPGNGGWCPIPSLRDDFEDTFRSREWANTDGTSGAGALEADGKVYFTLLDQLDSDYQYISSKNYDLSSEQVSVELLEHGANTTSFLELTRTGQSITFQITDVDDGNGGMTTEIQAVTNIDGDIQLRGNKPFNPAVHRFLRIRHDGVGLVWDTSTDGTSWPDSAADERHIATASPTPADLVITDLDVRFGARAGIVMAPGQTQLDNLNVLPSE